MLDRWPTQTVRHLQEQGILLVEDGNHGENRPRPSEFASEGTAFIRAADMDGGRILFATASRITNTARARVRKGIGRQDDILLSHKGTVGKIAVASASCEDFICSPQTTFWRVLDSKILDRRFLYFFMRSRQFRQQLDAVKGETDMADYVSLTAQRRIWVSLPPLDVQTSVASVLGALDDKIDLNRRMNATLEAMARAIFKDWFVDFGPTQAKMQGRAPYLAPDIWSLFPDRLDDEGKPEGWQIGTLADHALLNPESWTRGNYPPRIAYVDLSNTKWGTIEAVEMLDRQTAPSRAQRVLRQGDTIVGMVRPANGSFALVNRPGLTGSTGFAVLRPSEPAHREIVYLAATAPDNIDRLSHLADGAAYPAVRPDVVHATGAVISGEGNVEAFHKLAAPLIDRIAANQAEAKTLAATRDLLLPKLMSGELRPQAAERAVEAVT